MHGETLWPKFITFAAKYTEDVLNTPVRMKIKDVAETLERFAPLSLQESYDNAGLQIGLTGDEEVSGVLLCLDVTEAVLEEAEELGCNMVVAHHPLLFRPLKRVSQETQTGRCVTSAIRKGITVYAAHTNLDNAPDGVNFYIAEKIGLQDVGFLQPFTDGREGGSGAIGTLPEPLPETEALRLVAASLSSACPRYTPGPGGLVERVALCGGAGDFLVDEAVRQGAQLFFTGEVGYHRFAGHEDELCVAALGHFETEHCVTELLERILTDSLPALRVLVSEAGNPTPVLL